MFKKREKGFTLIELMIVVAIIGILAAIAIPRFAALISKAKEGKTKGNLGSVRSALAIYYGDNDGIYPINTTAGDYAVFWTTMVPTYLDHSVEVEVVKISAGGHDTHSKTSTVYNDVDATPGDTGKWGYNGDSADTTGTTPYGRFWVDCSGDDSAGNDWNAQ